jgi:hypothetical protein
MRRGFSLFETIVAVGIAAVFLGAIAVFTLELGAARERLGRLSRRLECADSVFAALDRAFASAVVADARGTAGIAGSDASLRVLSSGVGLGDDGAELLADGVSTEVPFDAARGRIGVGRGTQRDELDAEVRLLRIRYLGESGWLESYDSVAQGAFPAAIEVAIWFGGMAEQSGEEPSMSTARVPDEDAADEVVMLAPEDFGPPDRVRIFRIPGAPRVDPLALRRLREEDEP